MQEAGPSRQSVLQLFFLLSSAALAPAEGSCAARTPFSIDAAKLRIAAHRLFGVNSTIDTMAYRDVPRDVPSVDTIDRRLTISFELPELNVTTDASSPFNETCGRSWSCGCLRYEVCPGMELTTAMTRDFATATDTNGGPPSRTVRMFNGLASDHFHVDDLTTFGVPTDALVRLGRDHGQAVLAVVH
jgi:hypothetical protein